MQNECKLTLSKADVLAAVALWLNSQVLKEPVTVTDVKQRSAKAKPPGGFDITIRPQEIEETAPCVSLSPAADA